MNKKQVTVLERIVKVISKYGFFKILQALFVIAAFLYIIHNVSRIPEIVETVFSNHTEEVQIEHDAAIETRRAIKPTVDSLLADCVNSLKCDRAFILEMHNGTNNTAGLPFIYAEMTYEITSGNVDHIDEDYMSVNLSRFSFPLYLEKRYMFMGTTEELKLIDDKLAKRLSSNDVTYIAIMSMHCVDNELGYFGVSYCGSEPADRHKIIESLSVTSQKLAILLDSKNVDTNKSINE